jgi:hypothetical protein
MVTLERSFLESIQTGLRRAGSTRTSLWALNYIVLGEPIPGPMSFKYHPWSREWMDCNVDWVGMKAAQLAMTHAAIMRAMKTNDIDKKNVLYLLPKAKPDAADFSKAKFDTLLETSPYLKGLYSDTRNVGLKQAGSAFFYLRGSRSRSALKNISVSTKIFDEYDEMPQANVTLAEERSSGYFDHTTQTIKISTPTVPDFGIHKEFKYSTQEFYIFRCPRCTKRVQFLFPDCLVVTAEDIHDTEGLKRSHLICPECKGIIHHLEKMDFLQESNGAAWEPSNSGAGIRGFYLNQFYSLTVTPPTLAKKKLKAEASNNPLDEKEWWNSSGGLPRITQGAKVPEELVTSLARQHKNNDPIDTTLFTTMGVDPGKWIHVQINQWYLPKGITDNINRDSIAKVTRLMEVESFEYLGHLMREYQVFMCVIDGQFEHRSCGIFARDFFGHVYLAYTTPYAKGKEIRLNDDELTVTVNRTSWLDASQGRFREGRILIPQDYPRSYPKHISALVRNPTRDASGRPSANYISTGPDHYAFANLYNEIALPIAVSVQHNTNIRSLLG